MTTSTEALIALIEQHGAEAPERVQAQTDLCQSDGNRTLFDAAIASDNRAVIDILAQDKKALEFAAPIADELTSAVNYMLGEVDIEYPLAEAEERLQASFGDDLNFHRTPLLTACRFGNVYAMERLLAAGAKPAAKDRLKLTAPEICLYTRGAEGLSVFLQACKNTGLKPFAASVNLVRELLPHPALLEQLQQVAKFGTPVQNLLLCYYCARLDVEAVRGILAGKFDINKAATTQLHPLREACISHLFWRDKLPGSDFYAYHYIKHTGPAGSHSVHIDNHLIKPDGSNFDQLMREAEQQRKRLIDEANKLTLSDADVAEQLQKRCRIVDLLMGAGLDVDIAQKKLNEFFFDDLQEMPLQGLVKHLQKYGFVFEDEEEEKPYAETFWELAGETVLQAKVFEGDDGEQWAIELNYSNVYGPIDGVELSTREADPEAPTPADNPLSRRDWKKRIANEQWLDIDGEPVALSEVKESGYGEAPWQAIYRWTQSQHPECLEIWIKSPAEDIDVVLPLWEIY